MPRARRDHRRPLHTCAGAGRVEKRKTLSVKVPAGVDVGIEFACLARGSGANGGPLVTFCANRRQTTPNFQRDGRICTVRCHFFPDAALGGELDVPTWMAE